MKNSRIRAKKVRQRKVANLAAYSRQHTVKNIKKGIGNGDRKLPVIEGTNKIDYSWKNPEGGYSQPKSLRKKYKNKYYNKDGSIRKVVTHDSDYAQFPDHTFHHKGRAWFMEQIVQHKLAKWEKKNPCPVKTDDKQQDLFEEEFVVPWKAKREMALEHFRDFVVSMYDKLPLIGRFQKSETEYVEKPVAEIKDINMEGHKVYDLDSKKSKLLKKARKKTNQVKAKHANLICTKLKDHKRSKCRIILPMAA